VPNAPLGIVTAYLRRASADAEAATDAQLLDRYARKRDEDAFALLVQRHGPLVLGVCRRALGHSPDSDDAFQATFLALALKPGRVRDSLPGWLYRVAVRTSRKALRRQVRVECIKESVDPADPFAEVEWREVRRLLDVELDRLPAKWRVPLVLCFLQGRSRDEAARQLGWSLRTFQRRLDEGRRVLRRRLTRRGLAPSLLSVAVFSADLLQARVSPLLVRTTVALTSRDSVSSTIQSLAPALSIWGGTVMKAALLAVVLAGSLATLLIVQHPATADPPVKTGTDVSVLVQAPPAKAKPAEDPMVAKIAEAQKKGIDYVKGEQKEREKGIWNWENDTLTLLQPGGTSCLAMLALLDSGLKVDDEVVARGLKYIRDLKAQHTYVVSLQTQVLCKANQKADAALIKRNVKWLEDAANWKDGKLIGWSYTGAGGDRGDNSNSRYAIAGLHAAHKAGFKVAKTRFWEEVRDLYVQTQKANGGWGYVSYSPQATHTMTGSGLLCLTLAKDALGKDDKASEKATVLGFAWIAEEFRLKEPQHTFYNLDVIASLGRASERKDFGTKDKKHDWYRDGSEWLLKSQKPGGQWRDNGAIDNFPVVSTAFALRFLASRPD
jgi:RNA polymerase sigma factor (sigma-70 family)